jgi:hypothetical protein
MTDLHPHHLCTQDLLARDWTRTLIARFLPESDGREPVNHWANFGSTSTYLASRVFEIEKTEEFGKAFLRSWKGRMKGRKPEAVLKKLRETTDC